MSGFSRRQALTGAAGVGLGLPLLVACGGEDPTPTASDSTSTPAPSTPSAPVPNDVPAGAFTTTADIPVGGGAVFADEGVVVTQPSAGEFKGFSVQCTHAGCPVNQVTSTINCPCHGSTFSITDGSAQSGPATGALSEIDLTVDGDAISLA